LKKVDQPNKALSLEIKQPTDSNGCKWVQEQKSSFLQSARTAYRQDWISKSISQIRLKM